MLARKIKIPLHFRIQQSVSNLSRTFTYYAPTSSKFIGINANTFPLTAASVFVAPIYPNSRQTFATTPLPFGSKMSSDDAYQAFLDKSNKDYSGGSSTPVTTTSSKFTALSAGPAPPSIKALEEKERFYTSDTDEPFESVTLKWEKDVWPTSEQFITLISANSKASDITILAYKEWDPSGQYEDVITAVKEASGAKDADIKVYQVPGTGSRVEYFVLGLEKASKRLVGVRALAVES